jgi:hypothetical protein
MESFLGFVVQNPVGQAFFAPMHIPNPFFPPSVKFLSLFLLH